MGKNRDLYYKIASEFGLNTDDIYQVWKRYFHYKKEGGFSTDEIIGQIRTNFAMNANPELFNFFVAFGLAVLTEEMER